MSGSKLANAAGVSQPFLSQLESGQSSVAIATIYRLASALGVHPIELLPTPAQHDVEVFRADDRQRVNLSEHLGTATAQAVFRRGSSISEIYDYELEPKDYVGDWFSSEGEHALYVLTGSLTIEFESRPRVDLDAGDIVFYDSAPPHRWVPRGESGARIILVTAHRQPTRQT